MYALDVVRSTLTSSLAAWRGTVAFAPARRRPEQLLELYEFENCPYCRLVREALTELDLDALIRPCPKGGTRFRPEVKARGGKAQFPYLVDPNTGVELYESADIIAYLGKTYERSVRGTRGIRRRVRLLSSSLASLSRARKGSVARPSRAPDAPLELYSFESSPYSRLVREVLCELELTYVVRNTGKASAREFGPPAVRDRVWRAPQPSNRNRAALHDRAGHVQLPYLVDPSTHTEMFESADIIAYLRRTYAA